MFDIQEEQESVRRAVLVAADTPKQSLRKTNEYLDELEFLASTIGIETLQRFTQKLEQPHPKTFLGKGKLEQMAAYIIENECDVVIFDDELSASQVRNIENALNIKVYDRSLLILDIFLFRAKTAQAKAQVELARAQYLLPRLTNMWSHLERQRGGTGTRGGAGEKEIETDKRRIRNKISDLKEKLKEIDLQMATQRKNRGQMVRVSLAGYTNVGKSTIMNILAKSDVFAENKLFATIDSTVRKVVINTIPFLLTDTVGFIRKLPHTLVECFRSTLDEIREADIIIHVVDASNPTFEEQVEVVLETLKSIGVVDKPIITVFNKIDAMPQKTEEPDGLDVETEMKESYLNVGTSVFISAKDKTNLDELKEVILEEVKKVYVKIYPNKLPDEAYL